MQCSTVKSQSVEDHREEGIPMRSGMLRVFWDDGINHTRQTNFMTKSSDNTQMIKTFNDRRWCGHIDFPANKSNRSKLEATVNLINAINTQNRRKITLFLNQELGAE
ncbi:hypothetical protein O185_14810 [Photorhabdus temperata J3]|uniref:Uncharacterized protein n=1 Tax=Photorhabdus temperata J3 TaxID=1389415 RepID=U7R0G5_PHOTE|nr:hypothetical protein O185_14810 [Photorhabdus temperata J3]